MAGLVAIGNPADAIHDEGFALQGDVKTVDATPLDWEDLFDVSATGAATEKATLPDGFVRAGFRDDFALPDTSAYATGSKDTLPINVPGPGDWQCKRSNNVGDKFDIVNAYAGAMRPTSGDAAGDLIIFFGSEISSPNGNRNAGLWLLQDENVDCATDGGGNQDWAGNHTDGDVFVVSAFTNGGTTANITVYEWVDTTPADDNADSGGQLQLKFETGALNNASCDSATIGEAPINDRACAIVNDAAEVDPDWNAPDKDGGNLNVNEFMEGGINLSAIGLDACFSTAVANSRSSQEPGSTLHDFARMRFETCGELEVHKYIDADMSGTNGTTGDVNSGADVQSYSFTVVRDATGATVCTGTTNSSGDLVCSTGTLENLPVGTYTITETQKTGFFNTDPGEDGNPTTTPNYNTASTVSKTATMGIGNTLVEFGNTCYVDKTFRINGVPAGTGVLMVDYSATGPTRAAALTGSVSLTQTGTTATGTVNDVFNQTDTISWEWYLASDTGNKVTGATNESLATAGYPSCAKTNDADFPDFRVEGTKYKDANADGDQGAGETGLGGFVFELHSGTTPGTGTLLQTATSDGDGDYAFASRVPPGTYTVVERSQTGWVQTEPASGGRTFTVDITSADTVIVDPFGNTPLSEITVTFTPLATLPGTTTDATRATSISCVDSSQAAVGGNSNNNTLTTDEVRTSQSSVVCTVTYEDP